VNFCFWFVNFDAGGRQSRSWCEQSGRLLSCFLSPDVWEGWKQEWRNIGVHDEPGQGPGTGEILLGFYDQAARHDHAETVDCRRESRLRCLDLGKSLAYFVPQLRRGLGSGLNVSDSPKHLAPRLGRWRQRTGERFSGCLLWLWILGRHVRLSSSNARVGLNGSLSTTRDVGGTSTWIALFSVQLPPLSSGDPQAC
jgi:hypothetical protein